MNRPFRIASITKTFVAAATFRLVEQHRLDLDDDIGTAGVPDALIEMLRADGYDVGAITVHHLLDHTSGIANYTDEDTGADSPYTAILQ